MKVTKRKACWVLACVGVAGVLLSPPVYWRLAGWGTGELFFDGRPTSYWSRDFQGYWVGPASLGSKRGTTMQGHPIRSLSTAETVRAHVASSLGLRQLEVQVNTPAPLQERPDALPMLLVLLNDADPKVRWVSACYIGMLERDAAPAIDALRGRLNDYEQVDGQVTPAMAAEWAIRVINEGLADK